MNIIDRNRESNDRQKQRQIEIVIGRNRDRKKQRQIEIEIDRNRD